MPFFNYYDAPQAAKPDVKHSKKVHCVKSWPHLFAAALSGEKTHELRKYDRTYLVGDVLRLLEFDPGTQRYTGRTADFDITAITSAENPCAISDQGLADGYCILSIRKRNAAPLPAPIVLPTVHEIAKAILGPKRPISPGSKYSLAELRDVMWNEIATGPDKMAAVASAEAVYRLINNS